MNDRRPEAHEYDARYQRYLDLVPESDICEALAGQIEITRALLAGVGAPLLALRYAEAKWTIRETLGHIIDTERIFTYRILCFARGDNAELQRADQGLYVREGRFDRLPLEECLEELKLIRRSSIALLRHLPPEAWDRSGRVSGLPMTVRAIGFLVLGHERHHLRILREKYLAA